MIEFISCGECRKKSPCFFCKPKVENQGKVVKTYFDFPIPTVEVLIKGSDTLLELTNEDLSDPCLIKKINF